VCDGVGQTILCTKPCRCQTSSAKVDRTACPYCNQCGRTVKKRYDKQHRNESSTEQKFQGANWPGSYWNFREGGNLHGSENGVWNKTTGHIGGQSRVRKTLGLALGLVEPMEPPVGPARHFT